MSIRSKSSLKGRRRAPSAPSATAAATRERLVGAALKTLQTQGFSGTTARAVARTGRLNQALIFYHFGSLDRLLLAALDQTSNERLGRYQAALARVTSLADVVRVMSRLYAEDVKLGHVAAVQEMVAGGSSVPSLRHEVVARMEPWVKFANEVITRLLKGTLLESVVPVGESAFAAVALYFGIETLTHLDGDRSRADALFKTGRKFAPIADALLTSATWIGDSPSGGKGVSQ